MTKRFVIGFLLMLSVLIGGSGLCFAQASGSEEFRALWVTRFEWPDRNMETCKSKIENIVNKCADANFNAIVFQVRGQADTLYRSPLEPWSPIIGGKDPGWDPLAFAIEKAHAKGIELHAYINPIPAWQGDNAPTDPKHIFNTHGPKSEENWLLLDASGNPITSDKYYWLNPGIPEVHEYNRKVVEDLVTRYDIDGVHLDRIRFPSSEDHNPIARKRFQGAGNPKGLSVKQWRVEQLNEMVRQLSAAAWKIKPEIKMTAAVWGIYDKSLIPGYGGFSCGVSQYSQDSIAWLKEGSMDALCPMIYWDLGGNKPDYDECLAVFLNNDAYGRHVYGGMHAKFEPEELKAEVEITRKMGAEGTVIFAFGAMDKGPRFEYFGKNVYPQKVPTASMPWKTNPTQGMLVGYVKSGGAEGKAITDAFVTVEGAEQTALSSSDGYFAIFRINPGTHKVKAQRGGGKAEANVEIRPGEITEIELTM